MQSTLEYRPHVDGLRAIAILIVVLYHAHVPGVGGGFVGVDVFFVISGYLIIGLLSREFEQTGTLSLAGFFERRVRRLAPALMLVLATTLVLGSIYLVPIGGEQQGLARSAIATVLLVSNLYFSHFTGGYFDSPTETQPLLHTWSLSVEEQFYLFWPLVVLAAGRLALRRGLVPMRAIAWALAILFGLSLALSLWLTTANPQSAFFSAPTRAWEFAVGGLVFFLLRQPPSWIQSGAERSGGFVASVGLFCIALAATRFYSAMAFPGYLAGLPVLGAAAVIVGCIQAPKSVVARLLSWRPLVAIGLVSYGWYLWHWPLLAIARAHTLGEMGPLATLAVCVMSLGLAALTYLYVERPIRLKRVPLMATRPRAFLVGATAMVGVIALSAALGAYAKYVWPAQPANRSMRDALGEMRKVRAECGQSRPYAGTLVERPDCDSPVGSGSPQILVWGDSHASVLIPLVSKFAAQHATAMRIRYMPECPPFQDYSPTLVGVYRSRGCEEFNRDVLAEIETMRSRGLQSVVIAARWGAYLQNPEAAAVAQEGLRKTLRELQRIGVQTVVSAPPPEMPHESPACLARRSIAACGTDRASAERNRASVLEMFSVSIGTSQQVRIVDPFDALCAGDSCAPIIDGTVMFSDAHHLSEAGSMKLLPAYAPALQWSLHGAESATSSVAIGQ